MAIISNFDFYKRKQSHFSTFEIIKTTEKDTILQNDTYTFFKQGKQEQAVDGFVSP